MAVNSINAKKNKKYEKNIDNFIVQMSIYKSRYTKGRIGTKKMAKSKKRENIKEKNMTGSNLIFRGLVIDLAVILSKQSNMSKKKIIETIDTYLCELKLMNKKAMIRELNFLYKTGMGIANT